MFDEKYSANPYIQYLGNKKILPVFLIHSLNILPLGSGSAQQEKESLKVHFLIKKNGNCGYLGAVFWSTDGQSGRVRGPGHIGHTVVVALQHLGQNIFCNGGSFYEINAPLAF